MRRTEDPCRDPASEARDDWEELCKPPTDEEKAKRLLSTATRVMTPLESELCRIVESGISGGKAFAELCGRPEIQIYLR